MRVDALSYDLPPERIAQHPAAEREAARLLVVGSEGLVHSTIAELPEHLPPGCLLVVNDTRVVPARLQGLKAESGGRIEIFLVRHVERRSIELAPGATRDVEVWRAMGKASKPLRPGTDVAIGDASAGAHDARKPGLHLRLLGRAEDDGLLEVALWTDDGRTVDDAIRAHGHVPLPPYIKRDDDAQDRDRYQTIFARVDGAIAAPTAGLHLTQGLLGRLSVRGTRLASVTLHVGLGTFAPVTVEDLDQHPMHAEWFRVSQATVDAVAAARGAGQPVVAVGTTVARALESAADPQRPGHVRPWEGETRLLIQPGYRFQVVDVLLTNFHVPRSTLLAMVCAFAGTERVLAAYKVAVDEGYRFFSYGDAMLLFRGSEVPGGVP